MQLKYKFTKVEIDKLLKENLVIITDTREQRNEHVLSYFDTKKINYKEQTMNTGDYTAMIKADPDLGILRDLYLPVAIEKKNSIDELAQSFKERERFEAEFIRGQRQGLKLLLLVEDCNGIENIVTHNYRSQYEPKALYGSLVTFETRYNFQTMFVDKKYTGNRIYHKLRYYFYEYLKN